PISVSRFTRRLKATVPSGDADGRARRAGGLAAPAWWRVGPAATSRQQWRAGLQLFKPWGVQPLDFINPKVYIRGVERSPPMTWNKLSRRQQDYARRVAVPYVSGNSLRHTLRAARADAYIKAG